MKHRMIALAAVLALGVSVPAAAQTTNAPPQVKKIMLKGPAPVPKAATTSTQTAALAKAPFGCDARAPHVCHFRVHYARGSRNIVLPAGMKAKVPEVRIGSDTYCVSLNQKPIPKCARKVINAKYNS